MSNNNNYQASQLDIPSNNQGLNNQTSGVQSINTISNPSSINTTNKNITVTTNTIQAQISTIGGSLNSLTLLQHGSNTDIKKPYELLENNADKLFIAQTGLLSNQISDLPNHASQFFAGSYNYVLSPDQNTITVVLKNHPFGTNIASQNASQQGVEINKIYTFKRDSYVVDVSYKIINHTNIPLSGLSAYFRLLRDDSSAGDTKFVHTYTGAAYYDSINKFNKVSFKDMKKLDATMLQDINNGWAGFVQHYFASMWLLNAYGYNPVCNNEVICKLNFKMIDDNKYASVGLITNLPIIAANSSYSITVPLFVGPQSYDVLTKVAPELERTKDYGWVYIFATPLFLLLIKLFALVNNWGWAIVLLTVIVKMILYPLTRASYISMAKMKILAPKMEQLKTKYATDKVKLQQEMLSLYKTEKVNPIGGCLPMLLQIPVFIGLYWALLSSVELRHASFLWINDLSIADPFYILPTVLALLMFLQTFLNPAPTDPMQAKMMRFMPVIFSVMFFFFPAGLVVYWLINQVLSMLQQWYVNNHVTLKLINKKPYKK